MVKLVLMMYFVIFRVESPTSKVSVMGNKGVFMKAPAGGISIQSLTDFIIQSKNKAVSYDCYPFSI